ncbi:ATP-binding protein [Polynucleobacter paneuropaeus]|jgi:hypothetical protein|nr:ATP-binding protein [Polynucleobacter paneuropaeus]MBT8576313.1 ATP-binding protein [Polynucleobacter paneuropaeus]MBT8614741.1 ATP-binding protein [Polynucleobacter paneuropaeus]MBT8616223.1 ATP-binding protein [Polynucleobacter paneuropaeus]MBT8618104.1 ATP-binding protein [Polynucleobacter paneuropaeus]
MNHGNLNIRNSKYIQEDFSDLEQRYASVESYIEKMSQGSLRSLIINGPPGVGKTFSVESYLKKHALGKYKLVAGHMTTLSLYGNLYHYRDAGSVLVLDDIDSVLSKIEGVNILKAAMDTKPCRRINWESPSGLLNKLNLPTAFDFKGSVILISNIGFGSAGGKIGAHLDALKDRSYSLTIANNSRESLFKQLRFMVMQKNLLGSFSLSAKQIQDILEYVESNMELLPKISLRVAIKLAQLVKESPDNWNQMANNGLLNQSI